MANAVVLNLPEHGHLPGVGPSWGWSAVADVDVQIVPGEHLSALRPPHVQTLADRLSACLAAAVRKVDQWQLR